eukprot:CAMPEP_0198591266 /NCGR_PEP_ID=MMETSP1462-20131121/136663_1 /TAXON_ID=1333877 /ORGANISM="Brandtodinium nutriculum, Strain RCC3387" /LENGTH=269 /DNA_ID=CAMNT_0044322825 /DNA_START=70 /DNA_END=876 /DNA_ORIENTATION=+
MASAVPSEVAHHDASRSGVSSTALAVSALRALESRKPASRQLIDDPFAELLCGEDQLDISWTVKTGLSKDFWIDLMAVRTRWIDDALEACAPKQLVVLGSGLDTRAYRLKALRGMPVYEVDFPEVVDTKRSLLRAHKPLAELQTVSANLGADDWVTRLTDAGFKSDEASTWLLEGLTGYLTQQELDTLFEHISGLSVPGSRMIATFVGMEQHQLTSMHCYFIDKEADAEALLRRHGWSVGEISRLDAAADRFGRTGCIPKDHPYYLSWA